MTEAALVLDNNARNSAPSSAAETSILEMHPWERAERRYRRGKAAEELFYVGDDDDFTPRGEANEAHARKLCRERDEALAEMLITPAPDLYALAEKLRVALQERIDDAWHLSHEALSMLACDATRLINELPHGPLYNEMIAFSDRARDHKARLAYGGGQ